MKAKFIGKSFAIGMLILGAILGAGFASGRELVSFFGITNYPIVVALICAVLIFLVSVLFLFLSSKVNAKTITEVNTQLLGKAHFLADSFLLVNSLVVLAAMLAAFDSLGNTVFPIRLAPLYSILAGLLAAILAIKGTKALIRANKIVSPIMIAALVFIGLFIIFTTSTRAGFSFSSRSIITAIIYICMNMLLASTVVTTLGKINKKTIFLSSGIAAVSFGLLMFVLLSALSRWGNASADMPVLDMALSIHPAVYWGMVIVLTMGIFTTILTALTGLIAWFSKIFKSKAFASSIVLSIAFILSNLGFSTVVGALYPIIGALGVVYVLVALVFVIRDAAKAKKNKICTIRSRSGSSAKSV